MGSGPLINSSGGVGHPGALGAKAPASAAPAHPAGDRDRDGRHVNWLGITFASMFVPFYFLVYGISAWFRRFDRKRRWQSALIFVVGGFLVWAALPALLQTIDGSASRDAPLISASEANRRDDATRAADQTAAMRADLSGELMKVGSTGHFRWKAFDRKTDVGVTVLSTATDASFNFGHAGVTGLVTKLRIENRSDHADVSGEKSIAFSIYCARAPSSYQYFYENSGTSYSPPWFSVPADSYDDAVVLFGVPNVCLDDSVIAAKVVLDLEDRAALRWSVPPPAGE